MNSAVKKFIIDVVEVCFDNPNKRVKCINDQEPSQVPCVTLVKNKDVDERQCQSHQSFTSSPCEYGDDLFVNDKDDRGRIFHDKD